MSPLIEPLAVSPISIVVANTVKLSVTLADVRSEKLIRGGSDLLWVEGRSK